MPLRVNSQVAIIVYLFAIALLRPVSSCDALRQFRGMKITLSGHANCLSDLLIAVARAGNVNLLADASNFSKWSKSMHVSASNWSLCRVFADLCHEFQLTFQRREPFLMVWSLPDLKELYNYVSAQSYKLQDIVDVGVTSTVGNLITLRELQKYLYEQGYTAKRILELPKGESITLSLKALPKALRKKVIDEMQIRIAMEGGVSGFMTWHSERVNQAMVRIIDSVTTKIFKDGQWVSKEHPGPWLV
ncbi:MAG TPA: hypothetical protein EYP10_02165, partial [Armatimonadetes bacterium]|nr:hypothetical protein [Armatimonadota bacterium]